MSRPVSMDDSPESALRQLIDRAVSAIPGCAAASSTLWRAGRPIRQIASHPGLGDLLAAEITPAPSPVRLVLERPGAVLLGDSLTDPRWPDFCDRALRQGIRCITASVLVTEDGPVSMSLYGLSAYRLTPVDIVSAHALAWQGLAVLDRVLAFDSARREARHLTEAMAGRDVIEAATGMVMQALHCDSAEAFEELVRASSREGVKVSAVAGRLIAGVPWSVPVRPAGRQPGR